MQGFSVGDQETSRRRKLENYWKPQHFSTQYNIKPVVAGPQYFHMWMLDAQSEQRHHGVATVTAVNVLKRLE